MKVYTVIPIAKTLGKETLTYFGPEDVPMGSLVEIPLRKKIVHAIIIHEESVSTNKSELKQSHYALKKIGKISNREFLSSTFLEAASYTAHVHGTTTGSVLQALLPKLILENANILSKQLQDSKKQERSLKKEFLVVQDGDDDRFAHYKSFIRGEFAKGNSVYFCLPTVEDIKRSKINLEKGIEQYCCVLHSGLSKKEFVHSLELIQNEKHPILILGTTPFLSVQRNGFGSIILDRENSRSYRTQSRPYFDMRVFIKKLAELSRVRLIMGDLMLSIETLYHQKNEVYAELSPMKFRQLTSAQSLLVDMKLPKGEFAPEFRILSKELEALIDKSTEENENLFIFCGRKGLAPITVCGDCGLVVVCKRCGAPVTLYQREAGNIFACNKCGDERGTEERCRHCESWKLETLGIGAEGVEMEIKKRFPNATVFRMDKDNTDTPKKALAIIEKFKTNPGSVLIGTELALFYLSEPIENIAVASIDALLSLPDYRINEKIFYLLLTMRSRASKVFLIQTRNAQAKIFDYALKGNLSDFYRQEIDERHKFKYPPFSQFIKLSIEGNRTAVEKEVENLTEFFKEWNPAPFESITLSKKGNVIIHILFRFEARIWPDNAFLEKIKSLPPQIAVRVDPENLLG